MARGELFAGFWPEIACGWRARAGRLAGFFAGFQLFQAMFHALETALISFKRRLGKARDFHEIAQFGNFVP